MTDNPNSKKIKIAARKISFLMPHQEVLPDLKIIATQLYPLGADPDKIDRNAKEYLMGAYEALVALVDYLTEKNPQTKE
jgi:hypothetical protein